MNVMHLPSVLCPIWTVLGLPSATIDVRLFLVYWGTSAQVENGTTDQGFGSETEINQSRAVYQWQNILRNVMLGGFSVVQSSEFVVLGTGWYNLTGYATRYIV